MINFLVLRLILKRLEVIKWQKKIEETIISMVILEHELIKAGQK